MAFLKALTVFLLAHSVAASYRTVTSKFDETSSIRIKEFGPYDVCNGGVPNYSGWADMGNHHLFYWFFEARNPKPDTPVMLWMQGGPGGTALAGALTEHGPCILNTGENTTVFNPYSWTEEFHIIYIDQPVGVGYSYVDEPEDMSSYHRRTEDASFDIVHFIKLFQEGFPKLAANPFHIAGESYAGRFVPVYGAAVVRYNEFVEPEAQIPLTSLVIVSAWTSPLHHITGIYDMGCHKYKNYPNFFNESECAAMTEIVDHCEVMMESCYSTTDEHMCQTAGKWCDERITKLLEIKHENKYDRRMWCETPGACYPNVRNVVTFLNSPAVMQDHFEVGSQSGNRKQKLELMANIPQQLLIGSGDFWMDSSPFVKEVLDYSSQEHIELSGKGVDILFMSGTADVLCGPHGQTKLLDVLRWKRHAKFRNAEWEDLEWKTNTGEPAGRLRKVEGLWQAELEGGGHMIPADQPQSSLNLLKMWLKERSQANISRYAYGYSATAQTVLTDL